MVFDGALDLSATLVVDMGDFDVALIDNGGAHVHGAVEDQGLDLNIDVGFRVDGAWVRRRML